MLATGDASIVVGSLLLLGLGGVERGLRKTDVKFGDGDLKSGLDISLLGGELVSERRSLADDEVGLETDSVNANAPLPQLGD